MLIVLFMHRMDPNLNDWLDMFFQTNSELLNVASTPYTCPSLATPSQTTQPTTSHPVEPCTNEPEDHDESDDHDENDDYLANPVPENEHVGVDDELMYSSSSKTIPEEREFEAILEEMESKSGSESDTDYEEADGLIGKDPLPTVGIISYDKENPPMTVGSLYHDIKEFKLALCQHAIIKEFEFNTEKRDPRRVRVYCSKKVEDKCKWRIHASTMKDDKTIKVYC